MNDDELERALLDDGAAFRRTTETPPQVVMPHPGKRAVRWIPLTSAAAVIAVIAAIAGVTTLNRGAAPTSNAPASPPVTAHGTVAFPACADPAATTARVTATVSGQLADVFTGDRVTRAFTLESALTAAPPPAGYTPTVTAEQAGCQLAAAVAPNGLAVGPGHLALATVTIAATTKRHANPVVSPNTNPVAGATPPVYDRRVAWVFIADANNLIFGCPPQPAPRATPATAATTPGPHPSYEVFALDATTGTAAVMFQDSYSACGGSPTPPSVSVPYLVESVPWTEGPVKADKSQATITASWDQCEIYSNLGTTYVGTAPGDHTGLHAWIQQGHVAITVNRPLGPSCGAATSHTLTLHPERVGLSIPTTITHAPVGTVVDGGTQLAVARATSAASSSQPGLPDAGPVPVILVDHTWKLQAFRGPGGTPEAITPGSVLLRILPSGAYEGSDGCNGVTGTVSISGRRVLIRQQTSTLVRCLQPAAAATARQLQAATAGPLQWSVTRSQLTLTSPDGTRLDFRAFPTPRTPSLTGAPQANAATN